MTDPTDPTLELEYLRAVYNSADGWRGPLAVAVRKVLEANPPPELEADVTITITADQARNFLVQNNKPSGPTLHWSRTNNVAIAIATELANRNPR